MPRQFPKAIEYSWLNTFIDKYYDIRCHDEFLSHIQSRQTDRPNRHFRLNFKCCIIQLRFFSGIFHYIIMDIMLEATQQ